MSTYMPKAVDNNRKWYVLDAEGKPMGRVATTAAHILRGKHKVTFIPHADCGDHVIILNAEKAIMTGNKVEQKKYYRHSGWVSGLKEVTYKKMLAATPDRPMYLAVKGMLPDTTIGRKALTRLRVYAGGQHENAAQKPEAWSL